MNPVSSSRVDTGSLSSIHWLALGLVLATGIIHVYAGLIEGRIPVTLAGFGFLGATVVFLFGYRRPYLYLAGIAYTAVQFPLWYVANIGEFTTLGYVDKSIQFALIVVLAVLFWRERDMRTERHENPGTVDS